MPLWRFLDYYSDLPLLDLADCAVWFIASGFYSAIHVATFATTGAVHDNMDGLPREFGEHLSLTFLFILRKLSKPLKSAVAIPTPDVLCLYVLVGDGNQVPGEVDSQNKVAQVLRKNLMRLLI